MDLKLIAILLSIFFASVTVLHIVFLSKLVRVPKELHVIYYFITKLMLPITLIDTLIHELSHSIMVLLVRYKLHPMRINSDGSGLATYSYNKPNRIKLSLIALSGYIGSSIYAVVLAYMVHKGMYLFALISLTIIIALALLLLIRNLFGIIWSIGILGVIYMIFSTGNESSITYTMSILAIVLLFSSLQSSLTIMFLSFPSSMDSGDAVQLRELTFIPQQLWGLLFATFSTYCTYVGLQLLIYNVVHWETLNQILNFFTR